MKQDVKNGQILKGLRKQNGYTQEYIGSIVGKGKRSISRYELGTTSMPSSVITILNNKYNLGLKSTKKAISTTAKTIKEEIIAQAIESVQDTLKRVIDTLEDLKHYLREQN